MERDGIMLHQLLLNPLNAVVNIRMMVVDVDNPTKLSWKVWQLFVLLG